MSYVTRQQIAPKIPPNVMLDALDDNGDGKEDAGLLAALIASASEEVDGYLSGLFTVPFPDPAPPTVTSAALVFTCSRIYERRSVEFPEWLLSAVKFWRERLAAIGDRKLPLDASQAKSFSPGAVITSNCAVDAQST